VPPAPVWKEKPSLSSPRGLDDLGSVLCDQQRRRVAGQSGRARDNLRRVAKGVDFDDVVYFALANTDGSGRKWDQVVGDGDDLVSIPGIGVGVAQGAASRRAVNSIQVAGDVAAWCGNERGVDRHFPGSQRPSASAMAAHNYGAVQLSLADHFGDETVHTCLDPGDYAFLDVGNDLGIHGVNRAGGNADVAQAHGIELLHQRVQ